MWATLNRNRRPGDQKRFVGLLTNLLGLCGGMYPIWLAPLLFRQYLRYHGSLSKTRTCSVTRG